MPRKYSAPANSIVDKSLIPDLRHKIKGRSSGTTYVETITESDYLKGTAGETLEDGKFGHFIDGKIYLADSSNNRPADCFVVVGGSLDKEVEYVQNEYIVEAYDIIDVDPFLAAGGNITTVVPLTGFIQVLGDRIEDNLFLLNIQRPSYWP